jgi:hypothetical protein
MNKDKKYRIKNKDKILCYERSENRIKRKKEINKKRQIENPQYYRDSQKKWRENNPEKLKLKRKKDKEKRRMLSAKNKGFNSWEEYISNIEETKKRKEHIKNINIKIKKAKSKILKEKRRLENNKKRKLQRKIDLQYKITDNLRSRTRKILKIQSANKHTNMAKLIGLSGKQLVNHMLDLGYDNNEDHINHIIPLSRFDLTSKYHQLIACYYKNLRPLNAKNNMSKGNTLIKNWIILLKEMCDDRDIFYIPIKKYIINNI